MSEIKRDYSFYKFVHNCNEISNFCYVGSTSNVKCRKAQHKHNCDNPNSKSYNLKVYQVMRENGGFENFKMIIIDTKEQLTKKEAIMFEEEYRKSENANLNMCKCYISPEELAEYQKDYQKKWREEHEDYQKKWCEEHKEYQEYQKDYQKKWREEHKDYYKKWREEHKEYQEYQKEYQKDYQKKWREEHKDYQKKWREAKLKAKINE